MSTIVGEKLQKVLARAGLGSRRELEKWIAQGLVQVNRQTAKVGDRVLPEDHVSVRGRVVKLDKKQSRARKVLVYHKPAGEIVSRNDPEGRETIFTHVPRLKGERWIPVGRLDINTSGLLLLTTDGELAHRLMHPSYEIVRTYAVRIVGEVSDAMLTQLTTGVMLEDGEAKFDSVKAAGGEGVNQWFHVTLREGRTREVRRVWQALGLMVSRLIRIQYGPVGLPRDVRAGKWQYLSWRDSNQLAESVGLEAVAKAEVWRPRPGGKKQPYGRRK